MSEAISVRLNNSKYFDEVMSSIKTITTKKLLNKTKKDVGNYLVDKINKNFDDSSDSHGVQWEPLKYRTGKPLILTGALKKSIKRKNLENGKVEVSTNIFYGAFQNYGTNNIPARPFFPEANNMPNAWMKDLKMIVKRNYTEKK